MYGYLSSNFFNLLSRPIKDYLLTRKKSSRKKLRASSVFQVVRVPVLLLKMRSEEKMMKKGKFRYGGHIELR